jgi:hypothetical protein
MKGLQLLAILENTLIPCGSGLAREGGVSFGKYVARYGLFASKPAPTMGFVVLVG